MSDYPDTREEGDIEKPLREDARESEERGSPPPPVQIESKVTILTNEAGDEFICIPKQAYKYVLCIPQTIALKERMIEANNSKVKEYPIPLDWGLLTEFFVNGIKTPFEGLKIILPREMELDPFGKIRPPMPKVTIHG